MRFMSVDSKLVSIPLHWILMRLFTAIDLPEEMLEKIEEFLARLRPLAKLRWTAVENLHITTKFIGEWPEGRIEEMIGALGRVAIPLQAASLPHIAIRGVGWFPRVFWAGVEGGEPLAALARATELAVAGLGVPRETGRPGHLDAGAVKSKGGLRLRLRRRQSGLGGLAASFVLAAMGIQNAVSFLFIRDWIAGTVMRILWEGFS